MAQTLDMDEVHYVFTSKMRYTMGFRMWTTVDWNLLH